MEDSSKIETELAAIRQRIATLSKTVELLRSQERLRLNLEILKCEEAALVAALAKAM